MADLQIQHIIAFFQIKLNKERIWKKIQRYQKAFLREKQVTLDKNELIFGEIIKIFTFSDNGYNNFLFMNSDMNLLFHPTSFTATHVTYGCPPVQPILMPTVIYFWGTPESFEKNDIKRGESASGIQAAETRAGNENELVQKRALKKLTPQNPKRNIITNIGNQLITFISSRRKSERVLQKMYPQWTPENIAKYYAFADRVKQESEYYLNIDKLRKLWYNKSDGPQIAHWRKALRKLSFYHLNNILPASILSSRKMKGESKLLHLQARRIMVSQLRAPHHRFSFM